MKAKEAAVVLMEFLFNHQNRAVEKSNKGVGKSNHSATT